MGCLVNCIIYISRCKIPFDTWELSIVKDGVRMYAQCLLMLNKQGPKNKKEEE